MAKRILLVFAALLLFAQPVGASGVWSPSGRIGPGACSSFSWGSSDAGDAQPSIQVSQGELLFTAEITGAPSVVFYLVPDRDNPAPLAAGTPIFTATATLRLPTAVPVGSGYVLDPDIDTAGTSGRVNVCAAGYAGKAQGTAGILVAQENANYDVVANFDTGITRFATGELRQYTNDCLQAQEAINPYLDVSVTTFDRWDVRFTGTLNAPAADFFDQEGGGSNIPRNCLRIVPTASVIGAGNGGYSIDDATRRGWPEIDTRVISVGYSGLTATGGTATTIVDTGGPSALTSNGKYVRVTAGTCNGQIRSISGVADAPPTYTVDTAWSACTPDGTTVFSVFDIPRKISGDVRYTIDWDNVVILVDQTAQPEIETVIQRGDQWRCGQRSGSNGASACGIARGAERGSYTIYVTGPDAASTGWVDGRLAEMGTGAFVNADHAVIGETNIGATSIDISGTNFLYGEDGSVPSQDNIGLIHAGSWSFDRSGQEHIQRWGNGIIAYWNTYGTWAPKYVSVNHVGEARGTVTAGGNMRHSSSCTSGYCGDIEASNHGLYINNSRYESNSYGQIVLVDTSESGHNDLHLENGSVLGHQVVLGAGQCSAADATTVGRPCAEDANCGAGVCSAAGGTVNNRFTFSGGSLGSHSPLASDVNWRQAIMGRNASTQFGGYDFGGGVMLPTTNIPANSTGGNACTGAGTPYWYCIGANTNPALTVAVALPGVTSTIDAGLYYGAVKTPSSSDLLIWPYDDVSSEREVVFGPWVISTDGASNPAVGDIMPLNGGNEITPTTANLFAGVIPLRDQLAVDFPNFYLTDLVCTPGSYDDAGEAAESTAWRLWLTNVTNDTDGVNDVMKANVALSMTEGTHTPGTPVVQHVSVNTMLNSCEDDNDGAGGAECNSVGTSGETNLGLVLVAETDATGNNSVKASCILRGFRLFSN